MEDRRCGFEHGGWAVPYNDAVMTRVLGEGMSKGADLPFGRTTYDDFAGFWPTQVDNPITDVLNSAQKYVVSTTLQEPLPWGNSTVLHGDPAEAVAALKEQPGKDLVVLGSGKLVQSTMADELVDSYILLIHPLVLGSGRRLFADGGAFAALRLVDSPDNHRCRDRDLRTSSREVLGWRGTCSASISLTGIRLSRNSWSRSWPTWRRWRWR